MAETSEGGLVSRFLQRTDGSLLSLNFGTLAFVAGLQKFGDLGEVVNLRILVGGLCVGLFFAILCAYFTEFGTRATAASARGLNSRIPFHADLVTTSARDRGGWLFGWLFVFWMIVCFAPVGFVAQAITSDTARIDAAVAAIEAANRETGSVCKDIKPEERTKARVDELRARAGEAAVERLARHVTACERSRKAIEAGQGAVIGEFKLRRYAWNVLLVGTILLYLALPLAGWWLVGLQLNRPASKDGVRAQVDALQSLRLATAMLSLAAFMIGVGLALVNTGVTNFSQGVAESPPALPPPAYSVATGHGGPANAVSGPSHSAVGPVTQGSVTGPSIVVNVPRTLTLELKSDKGDGKQVVELKGLEALKFPPPPQTPSKIEVTGIPDRDTVITTPPVVVPVAKGEKGDDGKPGEPGKVWRCKYVLFSCEYVTPPIQPDVSP